VEEVCKPFVLSEDNLREILDLLDDQINRGLGKETNSQATVKCFPAYVTDLPDGKGKRRFQISQENR